MGVLQYYVVLTIIKKHYYVVIKQERGCNSRVIIPPWPGCSVADDSNGTDVNNNECKTSCLTRLR